MKRFRLHTCVSNACCSHCSEAVCLGMHACIQSGIRMSAWRGASWSAQLSSGTQYSSAESFGDGNKPYPQGFEHPIIIPAMEI